MTSENAPSSSSRSPNGPWQPPALEEIQALFPQYEIVALLGRGGMGAVYKGWQRSLDRFVAIKILPQGLTDDPQYSERFKQEAKSMAKLAHAGIVAVFDAGELSNGMLYFVMEFIEGTDVQKMIAEQGSLPPAHAMAITAHVCDALQYAHDRGIIHRDIKPANIMVGYDGVVKVADFGLAKQQQEGASGLTQSGMVMGTLHYMAPESLILGVSVDHRADIYAVGIMLYQMLTGRLPQGLFEMPSQKVSGLDPRYDAVIAKAIREDRDIRYQSAAELRADLDSILTQPVVKVDPAATQAPVALPTVARPQRPQGYVQRPVQPVPKKSSSTGILLVVALVLAAGGFWVFKDKLLPAPAPAQPVKAETPKADPATPAPSAEETIKKDTAATTPASPTAKPASMAVAAPKIETSAPKPVAPQTELEKRIAALETGFQNAAKAEPEQVFQQSMAALNKSYLAALDRALATATQKGELDDAVSLQEEKQRMEKGSAVPSLLEESTLVTPVRETLKKLRVTYRATQLQHETTKARAIGVLYDKYSQALTVIQADLTKAKQLDEALKVKPVLEQISQRKAAVLGGIVSTTSAAPAATSKVPNSVVINSLDMKFVPVPGINVLFCVHETRHKDYAAYAAENPGVDDSWKNQEEDGFTPPGNTENHPVVRVNWDDAQKFCAWLSQKEGKTYRLPTDREWSHAVGIGQEEQWSQDTTPSIVNKNPTAFPWGGPWPPPKVVGNFSDESRKAKVTKSDVKYLVGYDDGFPTTAPVMSFQPNKFGLYDLDGNVREWVEDWFDTTKRTRVLRGGSWLFDNVAGLLSSSRAHLTPAIRGPGGGFRIVVAAPTAAPAVASVAAASGTSPEPVAAVIAGGFTNSLGMKFVSVPGTDVLMCIHETRRKDFEAFANEVSSVGDKWKQASAKGVPCGHENDHPVVGVSWNDAKAFCSWLSAKEGRKYELPTDHQWSLAVGLDEKRSASTTPDELNGRVQGHYPWGTQWPPLARAGNYEDEAAWKAGVKTRVKESIPYDDGYPTTAPVMSFPPNSLGIYDLGGNVYEWCDDWINTTNTKKVVRGASWFLFHPVWLLSSGRNGYEPSYANNSTGFRVVAKIMAANSSSISVAPTTAKATPEATAAPVLSNTLGMKFVQVRGTSVLMCIHETRRRDYAAFAAEVPGVHEGWKTQVRNGVTFNETDDQPVLNLNYDDAKTFCEWLSKKEGRRYRLPSDREWSFAVGIGEKESQLANSTPEMLSGNLDDEFPWGRGIPLQSSTLAGNYADSSSKEIYPTWPVVSGYTDGFANSSPVMSFKPNVLGLYDMGGNAWEWVEDWYDQKQEWRCLRGASFYDYDFGKKMLHSSYRFRSKQAFRRKNYGFRCVLEIAAQPNVSSAASPPAATMPAAAPVPPPSPAEASASSVARTPAASVNGVPEMVFFETKGQVNVIDKDGKTSVGGVATPQGPMITTLVTSGCVVKTGAASAADLALAGGGSIRLDADSELRLSEVASGSVSVERLELLKGRLFLCLEPANLAKGDRTELRLKTPSASVVIKEAKCYAEIGGAYETIAVFEGLAEITELKQSAKIVLKDDMAVAVKPGTISTPKRLSVSQVALNGNCREIELVRTAQTLLPDEGTTIEDLYRFANSNSYVREEGHASFSQSEASKKALGSQVVRMAAYEPPNLAGRLVNFTPRVELRESKQPVVAIETCARSDGLNSLFAGIEAYDASKGQFAFQIVPNSVPRDLKLDPGAGSWGRLARKLFPLFGNTTSTVIKTVRPTFEIIFKGRNSCVIPGRKEYGFELTSIILVTRK